MNTPVSATPPARKIPAHYFGYLALLIWGALSVWLLNRTPYDLDEGGAKALLLGWSVADQVASAVVTFGAPDFRALLLLPVGYLWTGSVFAPKIFTLLLTALLAWELFFWARARFHAETALVASGLFCLSPLTLYHIDALAAGIYLLLALAFGIWADQQYRAAPRPFGGFYFLQLFSCAVAVSLHPAGLALPLALLWGWRQNPVNLPQQKQFFIGLSFATLLTLLLTLGWGGLHWFSNPLLSLSSLLLGISSETEIGSGRWLAGSTLALALLWVLVKQGRNLLSDLAGRTLLLALLLGGLSGDASWALLALVVLLFYGFPLLLTEQPSAKRPLAMVLLFIVSVVFMQADRMRYDRHQAELLSEQDQLIRTFADEAAASQHLMAESDANKTPPPAAIRIASQWPSRTMIACRCDTLPLPPVAKDAAAQWDMLRGVTHLMFNPKQVQNLDLSHNLAQLSGDQMETTALQPGGIILHKNADNSLLAPR